MGRSVPVVVGIVKPWNRQVTSHEEIFQKDTELARMLSLQGPVALTHDHPNSTKPPGLLGCCYGQQRNTLASGSRSPVRGDDPQSPEQTRFN